MLHRGRFIALALPVAFVAAITWFGVFTLVNAYVIKGLGHDDATWTTVDLALTVGMVAWQFVCAEIARGIGRRSAMTLALGLAAAAYAVISQTGNLWVIGGCLATMGLLQAMIAGVFLPMLVEAAGDRPGRALALYQWLITITTIVGVVGGGFLVDAGNYSVLFLALAGVILVCAVVFHRASAPLPRQPAHEIVGLLRLKRDDLRALFGGPFLVVLALGTCAEPFYYHMINHLFPNLARAAPYGFSEQTITQVVALGRLPSLLTTFLMAHWIDRVNQARWYSLAMALSALAAILLSRAPGGAALIVAYFIYYFFHGFVWGSNCATTNASVPARLRESAFAILFLVQTGTAALVGVLHQRLLAHGHSIATVYVISGVVSVAGAVALLAYSWRWRPHQG